MNMRSIKGFLILTCLIIGMYQICPASEWNGIRPLHSTRSDVERIFEPSVRGCKTLWCMYSRAEETVFIQYASGPPCGDEPENAWRVAKDTVVNLEVDYRKEGKLLSDLKIDLTNYQKSVDKHLLGWIYYINFDEGVEIRGSGPTDPAEMRIVRSIFYYAAAKDDDLRCTRKRAEQALGADSPRAGFFVK